MRHHPVLILAPDKACSRLSGESKIRAEGRISMAMCVCVHDIRCSSPKCSALIDFSASCCCQTAPRAASEACRLSPGTPTGWVSAPPARRKIMIFRKTSFSLFNAKLDENHSKSTKIMKFAWLTLLCSHPPTTHSSRSEFPNEASPRLHLITGARGGPFGAAPCHKLQVKRETPNLETRSANCAWWVSGSTGADIHIVFGLDGDDESKRREGDYLSCLRTFGAGILRNSMLPKALVFVLNHSKYLKHLHNQIFSLN